MKIWLTKNSEIPIRDQLSAQIIFGIASGDLPIGTRLPSTREISRRFNVHSNTVSGAYRELSSEGWLEYRKGAGFFVLDHKTDGAGHSLDKLIADFLRTAQSRGFKISEIKDRIGRFLELTPPEYFVVVEDDAELREILVREIEDATGERVVGTDASKFRELLREGRCIVTAMFDERPKIVEMIPDGQECVFMKSRSVSGSLDGETRPDVGDLIAVVSGWERFRVWARTMLVAANVDPECIVVRSTRADDWTKGLGAAQTLICDALTAQNFPGDERVRIFRLIADESIAEIRSAGPMF